MKICYRDDLGTVVLEVNMDDTTGISFDGQYAYFVDFANRDYRIATKDIIWIGEEQ